MCRREGELVIAKVIRALTDLSNTMPQVFSAEAGCLEPDLASKDDEVRFAYRELVDGTRLPGGIIEVSHQRHKLCCSQLLVSLDLIQDLGFNLINVTTAGLVSLVPGSNSTAGITCMLDVVIVRVVRSVELVCADVICKVFVTLKVIGDFCRWNDRLVFGCDDPKAGAVTSLWDLVRDPRLPHRVEVRRGVLADECAALLGSFFRQRRTP